MDKIFVTRSSMPDFDEYIKMIKPLWETHWLTNMGVYHNELEKKLEEMIGVDKVSLTSNGHMALEMTIQAMNFPQGSEIITTPFTFISTTHAIIRNGLKPVFCDIREDDFTIDTNKIENLITEKTVAILPVHVYGNICHIHEIEDIAFKYGLKVIYDAAHAFAEEYNGKNVGTYGDASVFSFHATKVFNTIEGGAVCCNNIDLYEKLYNLKNFGIRSEELIVSVGANAKMNEFQAAMGICNLKHLENEIEKRKACFERYVCNLNNVKELRLNIMREGIKSNYAYMPVLFKNRKLRDAVYNELKKKNIYSRKYFYPITSEAACFKNKYREISLDVARRCSDSILVLPLFADLKFEQIDKITELINRIIKQESSIGSWN